MFDREKLKRVIAKLNVECKRMAEESGIIFQEQFIAERVFPYRKNIRSQRTGWAQFMHKKIEGLAPLHAVDIDDVFRGFRRAIHDLVGGEPGSLQLHREVREVEQDVLHEFGLIPLKGGDNRDLQLAASLFVLPTYLSDDRTPALAAHFPLRMRMHADKIREFAVQHSGDTFEAVCVWAGAQFIHTRPDSAVLSNHCVIADSLVFDNSDWELVPQKKDIIEKPIQACYCTRVIRVRVDDPDARSIAFEFNSSGYGVLPVPPSHSSHSGESDQLDFRFLVQHKVRMTEAGMPTRTSYFEYDLVPGDLGRERTFMVHCIFFNGVQNQFHACGEHTEEAEVDWHGKRVAADTQDADMTVILPVDQVLDVWRFVRRPEQTNRDQVEEPDQKERIFDASMQRSGTSVEGVKAIWKIPPVKTSTIFSFQWSWE